MKIKDIYIGKEYKLISDRKSTVGCSSKYFSIFKNKQVVVLNKLNNFNNKNTIHIQGLCQLNDVFELVSFWCSPYDLVESESI